MTATPTPARPDRPPLPTRRARPDLAAGDLPEWRNPRRVQARLLRQYAAAYDPLKPFIVWHRRHYEGLITWGLSPDEIRSHLWTVVLRAAVTFNPHRGVKFTSYANNALRWAAVAVFRELGKDAARRGPSLDDRLFVEGGAGQPFADLVALAREPQPDAGPDPTAWLRALDPRSRRVVEMRFGLDSEGERTLAQIGNELGVSKERARQICKSALDRIRTAAEAQQQQREAS